MLILAFQHVFNPSWPGPHSQILVSLGVRLVGSANANTTCYPSGEENFEFNRYSSILYFISIEFEKCNKFSHKKLCMRSNVEHILNCAFILIAWECEAIAFGKLRMLDKNLNFR